MTKENKSEGQQPEVLAKLADATKSGGKIPGTKGLAATAKTAPVRINPVLEVDAATKVLREDATGTDQGAKAAIEALPDRTRGGGN